MSGAIYAHPWKRERKSIKFDPQLAVIRSGWQFREMVDGGPSFLGDHAEIAVNHSTRQTTLFAILIAATDTIFPVPFTHTHLGRAKIARIRSIHSRAQGLNGGSGKWRTAGRDIWRIMPISRPFHRLARQPSFQS